VWSPSRIILPQKEPKGPMWSVLGLNVHQKVPGGHVKRLNMLQKRPREPRSLSGAEYATKAAQEAQEPARAHVNNTPLKL